MKMIVLAMLFLGCARHHITPVKINKQHTGSGLSNVMGKYHTILDSRNWDIRNFDAAGGFLKAMKEDYFTWGLLTGVIQHTYVITLSCFEKDEKTISCPIRFQICDNRVLVSSCRPIRDFDLERNDELRNLAREIESL